MSYYHNTKTDKPLCAQILAKHFKLKGFYKRSNCWRNTGQNPWWPLINQHGSFGFSRLVVITAEKVIKNISILKRCGESNKVFVYNWNYPVSLVYNDQSYICKSKMFICIKTFIILAMIWMKSERNIIPYLRNTVNYNFKEFICVFDRIIHLSYSSITMLYFKESCFKTFIIPIKHSVFIYISWSQGAYCISNNSVLFTRTTSCLPSSLRPWYNER